MAGGNARTLTDDELLGGDDDAGGAGGDNLDNLDEGEDGVINGAATGAADDDDDAQVVIIDKDEGADEDLTIDQRTESHERIEGDLDDPGEVLDPMELLTEAEKKNYSLAVQKRIGRERRLKKQAIERAEAAERGAAEIRAQVHALTMRALEAEKTTFDLLGKTIQSTLQQKQAELEKAIDDGDTKAQAKLQVEIGQLQLNAQNVAESQRQVEERIKTPPPETRQPNAAAQTWISRNRWFGNEAFAEQAAITRTLDAQLARELAEGKFLHDKTSAEYFIELDRRIHRNMPHLRQRIQKAYGQTQQRTRTASPSAAAASGRKSGQLTLTKADLENIRQFGGDPKDKKTLVQYARAKQSNGEMSHG